MRVLLTVLLLVPFAQACRATHPTGAGVKSNPLESLGGGGTAARDAVADDWGKDMRVEKNLDEAPEQFPGLYDQPNMSKGPGSCGFTAIANISRLLNSTSPAAPWANYTPWSALENGYNTNWGILPSTVIGILEKLFASNAVPPAMRGTRFLWRGTVHYTLGRESYSSALTRLQHAINQGRPVIALTKWGGQYEHYVVVAADDPRENGFFVATWGKYERIKRPDFMAWWRDHGAFLYGTIEPTRASLLPAMRQRAGLKLTDDPGDVEVAADQCDADGTQFCCVEKDADGKDAVGACSAADIDGDLRKLPEFIPEQRPAG